GGARAPRTARRRHRLRRDRRAVAVRPAGSRLQAPAHPAQRSIDRRRDQLGSIRLFVVLSIGAPPARRRACSDTAPVIAAWMLAYVVTGAFVGFLAGLLGIGGGMTLVPVLAAMFSAQHFAHHPTVHRPLGT